MTRTIRITEDVGRAIHLRRQGNETPNDTIRRLIGLPPTSQGERRARGELRGQRWSEVRERALEAGRCERS